MPTLLGVKIGHGGQFEPQFFRPVEDEVFGSVAPLTTTAVCVCVCFRECVCITAFAVRSF